MMFAYSVEFEALVCFFIVVPDGSVVLIHHDAWTAPMQMDINHCHENKIMLMKTYR
jgi:hypothetical protein